MAEGKYALAIGKTGGELVDNVNGLMGEGWAPVGGPLVADQDGEPVLFQAVVRSPKSKPKKEIPIQR